MITSHDLNNIKLQAAYTADLRAEGAANARAVLAGELLAALGVPERERLDLIEQAGPTIAWKSGIDAVRSYVHNAARRAEAEAGQPRRPGTAEAAAAYPEGAPSALFGDH